MIRYEDPVIRPPAEADALILQVTIGCSHNRCGFCVTYQEKQFRARSEAEVFQEIDWAAHAYPGVQKVFLGDGDALALSTDRFSRILHRLYGKIPTLKRVSTYASPGNFKNKSVGELARLKEEGLSLVYVGFESGDDEVLQRIDKGFTQDEMVAHCLKSQEAGLKMSATVILGLGGPRLSQRHAEQTACLIDRIKPRFASALTLMLPPRTPSYQVVFGDPDWRMLKPLELLMELRYLVAAVEENGIIFRSNHASNYLALAGTFQKGKARMLTQIDEALKAPGGLRPEYLRGL